MKEKRDRPITLNLTQTEWKFVSEKMKDMKISTVARRLLLQYLDYPALQEEK